jgi:hypothetical protein
MQSSANKPTSLILYTNACNSLNILSPNLLNLSVILPIRFTISLSLRPHNFSHSILTIVPLKILLPAPPWSSSHSLLPSVCNLRTTPDQLFYHPTAGLTNLLPVSRSSSSYSSPPGLIIPYHPRLSFFSYRHTSEILQVRFQITAIKRVTRIFLVSQCI